MSAHIILPKAGKGRVLDFDIENRPLSYWIADRPTAEITAIASCWVGDLGSMQVGLLGQDDPKVMLEQFVARYNEADIVVGHYIRKHDLPIINGALMEYGLASLTAKLTCDTRLDLTIMADIPQSQEHLCEVLGVQLEKVHMTQHKWREANRLLPAGIAATFKRVSGDVLQNMLLREELMKRQMLGPPRTWRPGGAGMARYASKPDGRRHHR